MKMLLKRGLIVFLMLFCIGVFAGVSYADHHEEQPMADEPQMESDDMAYPEDMGMDPYMMDDPMLGDDEENLPY